MTKALNTLIDRALTTAGCSLRSMICGLLLFAMGLASCGQTESHAAAPESEDQTIVNTIGMKLVLVPAGSFTMGNPLSFEELKKLYPEYEEKRLRDLRDEYPAHKVNITKSFYVGAHEVTVGQFREFVKQSGYVPESIADRTGGYGYNPQYDPEKSERGDAFEGRDPKYSWENPGFPQTDAHPVVNVTWRDAVALADWLTKTEGKTYRLPTEAEWEYACRAGSDTQYDKGNAKESLVGSANVFDQDSAANWLEWKQYALPIRDGFAFTAPVGKFKPNAFGIYDMHGNVWEWTNDWYGDTYYAHSPTDDPTGPSDGKVRVRRGGSWHTWPLYTRNSYRNWNTQATRYTLVGIRLVMDETKTDR